MYGDSPNHSKLTIFCNPKVLGESPKMINSQKWSGEGAEGSLSSGSKSLPRVFLHHPKPVLYGWNPILHRCNPIFAALKRPLHPFLTTFVTLPLSHNLRIATLFCKGRDIILASRICRPMLSRSKLLPYYFEEGPCL